MAKSAPGLPQQWRQWPAKQNLAVQHYQLRKLVEAQQVSYHLHPPLWLWNMDPACWLWEKDPGLQNKVPEKFLLVSHLEHKTSDWLRSKINSCVPLEPLLAPVKRQKLAWFGHVTHHNSLSKTILQGTFEGGQCRGRQRKCWTFLTMPDLLIDLQVSRKTQSVKGLNWTALMRMVVTDYVRWWISHHMQCLPPEAADW